VANETPVLLLGYNRPYQMRGLIQSLAPLKPKLILFSVDGPKTNRPRDADLVRQTQELINEITWDAEIYTRFRDCNLGLRRAVVDAVTWANSKYGQVIVLEDDVRVGPQLLDFLNQCLITFRENSKIAHISGYNLVPAEHITHPDLPIRLSIYPESYAWATWDRAWQKYDDDMTWARNASIEEIKSICGSTLGALRWRQNFADALAERIDTWAYRWLASMWERRLLMISPNQNLANYCGQFDGTHTFGPSTTRELPVGKLNNIHEIEKIDNLVKDENSDKWICRHVFRCHLIGIIVGIIRSMVLSGIKLRKLIKKFSVDKKFFFDDFTNFS